MVENKFKFPKMMGACADRLYELKANRLEAQKIADAIETEEKALKTYLIENLPKSEASGVAGKVARVTIVTRPVPQVKDWEIFWKKFNKKKDFDLLQHRLNNVAVEKRWEAGKEVPGIGHFNVVTISLSKV